VQESHTRIDPVLDPVDGNPDHKVACLLDPATRKRLWRELQSGVSPDEARADVMQEEGAA
jgi:peptide/nickel transport system ATP-binding protein